ncbi:ImmA/IrrE family metallo-endopeptidase [Clostridioides difficile]|uniref:ImmA/IrrE family metallo-endopeptidase n=1 Tax=Clostridioides difficile TaxID=1496 RepID=UPI0022C7ED1F|nr:ImmA/IrrE family metallo-endopeptidase [Clostridioides difficile]
MEKYDCQGFAFWSKKDNKHIICYNNKYSFYSVHWTLTHEIAHIALGHTKKTSIVKLNSRNKLLELEAEIFTQHLLCPDIILLYCDIANPYEIMYICGVNKNIALIQNYYLEKIKLPYYMDNLESSIKKQFHKFIKNYLKYKKNFN